MLPGYRRIILDKLARTAGLHDLESRIRVERVLTPQDIHDRLPRAERRHLRVGESRPHVRCVQARQPVPRYARPVPGRRCRASGAGHADGANVPAGSPRDSLDADMGAAGWPKKCLNARCNRRASRHRRSRRDWPFAERSPARLAAFQVVSALPVLAPLFGRSAWPARGLPDAPFQGRRALVIYTNHPSLVGPGAVHTGDAEAVPRPDRLRADGRRAIAALPACSDWFGAFGVERRGRAAPRMFLARRAGRLGAAAKRSCGLPPRVLFVIRGLRPVVLQPGPRPSGTPRAGCSVSARGA